ncbi:hypothetical protein CAOG_01577 [Capsaspora owczarzaki ATCC 30864]|uniref:hypothetical protein n=1 Tax=Capsaspora owczarzaki (strain ATCC 30864) TaxID=595528 RepID=UPI0003522D76|nr:hypothetical protein CAOG_01577 [Capsaspora owczarzaki ATCC 30864]|eukprot:XP_004364445.2 hypothetical protein CAOG_01577 [Capsaspora owczarzaki ATCC 30864]
MTHNDVPLAGAEQFFTSMLETDNTHWMPKHKSGISAATVTNAAINWLWVEAERTATTALLLDQLSQAQLGVVCDLWSGMYNRHTQGQQPTVPATVLDQSLFAMRWDDENMPTYCSKLGKVFDSVDSLTGRSRTIDQDDKGQESENQTDGVSETWAPFAGGAQKLLRTVLAAWKRSRIDQSDLQSRLQLLLKLFIAATVRDKEAAFQAEVSSQLLAVFCDSDAPPEIASMSGKVLAAHMYNCVAVADWFSERWVPCQLDACFSAHKDLAVAGLLCTNWVHVSRTAWDHLHVECATIQRLLNGLECLNPSLYRDAENERESRIWAAYRACTLLKHAPSEWRSVALLQHKDIPKQLCSFLLSPFHGPAASHLRTVCAELLVDILHSHHFESSRDGMQELLKSSVLLVKQKFDYLNIYQQSASDREQRATGQLMLTLTLDLPMVPAKLFAPSNVDPFDPNGAPKRSQV